MADTMRICVSCGNEYSYCPRCGKDARKPKWMSTWCSEACKDVMMVVADFKANEISADEAKAKLAAIDMNKTFKPSIVDEVNAIKGVKVEAPKEESKEGNKGFFAKKKEDATVTE